MNESDFQLMASYGLNHVRIPFGYWMYPDALSAAEPYVTGVCGASFV
jgi:aryl-phospho-beta-D-glucosidase BglC (GH1 family)